MAGEIRCNSIETNEIHQHKTGRKKGEERQGQKAMYETGAIAGTQGNGFELKSSALATHKEFHLKPVEVNGKPPLDFHGLPLKAGNAQIRHTQ